MHKKNFVSVADRVANGLNLLDGAAAIGVLPKQWSLSINVDKLSFADYDRSPLAHLFGGSYNDGRKALNKNGGLPPSCELGLAVRPYRNGRARYADNCALLAEWRLRLRSDKQWTPIRQSQTRLIKGIRYMIFPANNGYKIYSNVIGYYSVQYNSVDSAKRAIRRLTQS